VGQFAYNKYWNNQNIKKTIAVLPFRNDSQNEENLYFCNGIMQGILDHLSKIPDLIVVSRTSVEQYRDKPLSSKIIAEELGVKYLVEGSVQRIGNKAIIFAQLISAEDDKHLWSHKYNKSLTDIFAIQADVTESIAKKLKAIISPELRDLIDEVPTENILAYDYYLRGNEFRFTASASEQEYKDWINLLDKAQLSYELAIEKDTLFAQAYIGLAAIEYERKLNSDKGKENYLKGVLKFANMALSINPNLSGGYEWRGQYYLQTNQIELAKKDYKRLLELYPNKIDVLYFNTSLRFSFSQRCKDSKY
jgi:TolB-like protein